MTATLFVRVLSIPHILEKLVNYLLFDDTRWFSVNQPLEDLKNFCEAIKGQEQIDFTSILKRKLLLRNKVIRQTLQKNLIGKMIEKQSILLGIL
jgi:hypothetical protein|tara:strand:+ start:440 stop:721 length:282 start_codon:yes stop_codon:yes gene_type:complete